MDVGCRRGTMVAMAGTVHGTILGTFLGMIPGTSLGMILGIMVVTIAGIHRGAMDGTDLIIIIMVVAAIARLLTSVSMLIAM